MKKKLIIGCIILSGIVLSSIKYNAFNLWSWTSTDLSVLLVGSLIIFLGSIIYFNLFDIEEQKNDEVNEKIIDIPKTSKLVNSTLNVNRFNFNDKWKYYLSVGFPTLLLSLYLGFKKKIYINEYILSKASRKSAKWQRDDYISSYTANDGFFQLKGYRFNFEFFIFTMIVVLIIAFVIRNTIYFEKIKSFIQTIKRN